MEKSRVQLPCLAPLFVGIIWCLMLESEWKYKFIGSSVWEIWIQIQTGKKRNFSVFSADNLICAITKFQIEMQGISLFSYLRQWYWKKKWLKLEPLANNNIWIVAILLESVSTSILWKAHNCVTKNLRQKCTNENWVWYTRNCFLQFFCLFVLGKSFATLGSYLQK